MIKQVLISQHFCDVCEKESYQWSLCTNCGKNICHNCQPANAKNYTHSVWTSGSGDGMYCLECDAELAKNGNKLHAAYRLIQSLRNESNGFYADFKDRADKAEETIKSLRKS